MGTKLRGRGTGRVERRAMERAPLKGAQARPSLRKAVPAPEAEAGLFPLGAGAVPPTGPTDPGEEEALVAACRAIDDWEERVRYRKAVIFKKLSLLPKFEGKGVRAFGEYLVARGLGTRMTAHKYFVVLEKYSEEQMIKMGGMEKAFVAIMGLKKERPGADPRELLRQGARLMGEPVEAVSGNWIKRATESWGTPAMQLLNSGSPTVAKAVLLMGDRMRRGLKRVGISAEARAWVDRRRRSLLSVRFELNAGNRLVQVLKHAQATGFA